MSSTEIDFSDLSASLSASASLTFPTGDFVKSYANWTDYDVQKPLAVVKPGVEADIVATIRFAGVHHLRVAVRAGGHSAFNTISGGLLVDLSGYKAVTYDRASGRLTVKGSATSGDALPVLAKNGRCALTGTCNGVGIIPLYLGGGYGPLTPKIGMGIDNLISARLLLASGETMTVSSTENRDVFDSLRGGGQILGIVSEIQVATYPLAETLNTTDGTVWSSYVTLSADRAADLVRVLEKMKLTREMALYLLVAPAGQTKRPTQPPPPPPPPRFCFTFSYYGSDAQAEAAFADLLALNLPVRKGQRVPYAQMNDRNDTFQKVGGFKRFFGVGLQRVSADHLQEVTEQLAELMAKRHDFEKSYIFFELLGMEKTRESSAGIYPHRGVDFWCLPVAWYSDPKNHDVAEQWGLRARDTIKAGDVDPKTAVYTNFRAGNESAGELWGSRPTSDKLRQMKKKLDPGPMFQSFPGF